jgi:hypothetical protein
LVVKALLERQIHRLAEVLVLDPREMRPRERAPAPELIPYVVSARGKGTLKLHQDGHGGKEIVEAWQNFLFSENLSVACLQLR